MEQDLTLLVNKLTQTFESRLLSVVLYGSAADDRERDAFSDRNVLCVLRDVSPRELADAAPIVRWWREKENPSPLLLSESELVESTDCFPIEFYDIKERHRLLHGTDLLGPILLDGRHHRAQLEHELRSKLIRLRQQAAGLLPDKLGLLRLMADSVTTFCVLGRHVLLIGGAPVPPARREVVAELERRYSIPGSPFLRLLDVREKRLQPKELDATALFEEYLAAVKQLVAAVNRLES